MTIIEHSMPVLPGEDHFPSAHDERFQLFWNQLVADGLMDDQGRMLKPARILQGMDARGWIVRLEVK